MAKAFPVLGVSILFLCLAPANALIVLAAAALLPALIVIKES
jgi:energy-converting hydrogenase Eha subunit E